MMRTIFGRFCTALLVLFAMSDLAVAQSRVTIAIGGGACLCYLPTVLAKELGEFDKAGLAVELVDLKGGSDRLRAVLGGSADVVSGYFDHCVNLAAKKQELQAFVVYDRYPGLVLVVSPKHTGAIKSIKDLAGKKIGVSAPGSSTDFFLKYLLSKNGVDANSIGVIGIGLEATAVAAQEQGMVEAAVMLDPAVTLLQGQYQKETQGLTNAILATLKWIHSHTPEEIMAKMPPDLVGPDKELYLAALKNTIPMYSTTGRMDPKGAQAVLAVFSQSVPDIAKANIDLSKTYTNRFVEAAAKGM